MSSSLKYFDLGGAFDPIIEKFAVGTDPILDKQLIIKSNEPNILKFTPKDSSQRFASQATLDKWREKGREMHWMIGSDNDLAGLIWYGKSEFPLNLELDEIPADTFAIRIYDGYQGHGLARPFMKQSLIARTRLAEATGQKVSGIWLQTEAYNHAAVKAYTKFGYREVARDDTRVTMILTSQAILMIAKNS